MVDVPANYRMIIDRIGEAATKAGRKPEEIKILAAAKSQSVELIRAAITAGVRMIGENYVQEAEVKRQTVSESVEWHMIGHLQRNKAKAAIKIFDLIQSLDSVALALELNKEGKKQEKKVRTLIEVNLGGEATKSGIAEDQVKDLFEVVGDLTYLSVEGLMTVPPFKENPQEQRPYFSSLRELQEDLESLEIPNVHLKELSMGMTHDYAVAVEEGATIVRIGTALFWPEKDLEQKMFVMANLLIALAQVLDYILWAYWWILLGRVVISWVNADPDNPIVRFLYMATEPVLARVRRWLPVYAGGFDLSPVVVWIAVIFLQRFLVRSLYDLAYSLR